MRMFAIKKRQKVTLILTLALSLIILGYFVFSGKIKFGADIITGNIISNKAVVSYSPVLSLGSTSSALPVGAYPTTGSTFTVASSINEVTINSSGSKIVTKSFPSGWNFISFPIQPANASPESAFVNDVGAVLNLNGKLLAWNNSLQQQLAYTIDNPEAFGKITSRSAYWVLLDSPQTFKISGYLNSNPQRIPLTKGWNAVGYPHEANLDTTKIKFKNLADNSEKILADAASAGWIQSAFYRMNGQEAVKVSGLVSDAAAEKVMQPWYGYWVEAKADNIEMIIPQT